MVLQNPTRFKSKAKVRKVVSSSTLGTEEHKKLFGPREAIALEVLHMMFLKQVAKHSNFASFQKKKNVVDRQSLRTGVKIAEEKCFDENQDQDD